MSNESYKRNMFAPTGIKKPQHVVQRANDFKNARKEVMRPTTAPAVVSPEAQAIVIPAEGKIMPSAQRSATGTIKQISSNDQREKISLPERDMSHRLLSAARSTPVTKPASTQINREIVRPGTAPATMYAGTRRAQHEAYKKKRAQEVKESHTTAQLRKAIYETQHRSRV